MTTDAGRLYRVTLLASLLALALTFSLGTRSLLALPIERPSLGELAGACRTLLPSLTPAHLAALVLIAVGATATLLAARSVSQHAAARRALQSACRTTAPTTLATGHRVRVLPDATPRAFCTGLLRPQIFISTGALAMLSPRQLEAVLAHEAHHARHRHPLRIAMLGALADSLVFLPILRRLAERHATLCEIAADQSATLRTDHTTLAGAMLTFADHGAAPERARVDALIGRQTRWTLPISLLLGTLAALLAFGALTALGTPTGTDSDASSTSEAARTCILVLFAAPLAAATVAFTRSRRPRPTEPGPSHR